MANVDLSASKVVALIGALLLIAESIGMIFTGINLAQVQIAQTQGLGILNIVFGIIGLLAAAILILAIQIIEIKQIPIPYEWWLLFCIGGAVLILWLIAGNFGYASITTSIILILTAGVIELLADKKDYLASQIVALIGAIWVIYNSILFFIVQAGSIGVNAISYMIFGLICGIILILTMIEKVDIKIPYEWWTVLIIGWLVFTWVNVTAGIVILVAFILILMDY
ncbi:MAG: hypothetical protein EAX96_09430 [Candidatus Lokiarchaeota archaeon]|nr:hypothetical protein [Candidatus Lokiarchaeota archaeon]